MKTKMILVASSAMLLAGLAYGDQNNVPVTNGYQQQQAAPAPSSAVNNNQVQQQQPQSQQQHIAPVESVSAQQAIKPLVATNTQAAQAFVQSNAPAVQPQAAANNAPTPDVSGLTVTQRLARLEQQVANMQQAQNSQQLAELKSQVQNLQGQLDVQSHELKIIQAQQRDIYQDLDSQIAKLSQGKSGANNVQAATNKATKQLNLQSIGKEENLLKEQDVYEHAYSYIRKREYPQAIKAMQDYLKAYPQGRFAVNAHYWLGELYLVNGNNANAKEQFVTVVDNFPKAAKASDALLKLGYMAYDNGNFSQARAKFRAVAKRYPNSTAARLALQRLQKMGSKT